MRLIKHAFRKLLLIGLFKRYVLDNEIIQKDIEQTISVRGCQVKPDTIEKKFHHLLHYYPDFAFIFFWRINKRLYRWRFLFLKDTIPCKIFNKIRTRWFYFY